MTEKLIEQIRKEAGLKIDPETAEVDWTYAQVLDPYGGAAPNFPEEYWCVGREYFARSPGSDIWVQFWRSARGDARCAVGKAQTKAGVPRWTGNPWARDLSDLKGANANDHPL